MLPAESDAIDQMYVDGVVASALKAGASSSPPSLRRAMPLAVPLVSSSNFDCSQVRVPSARATVGGAMAERINADSRASVLRAKGIPLKNICIVIPSEARDLQFAARCRSLASLGMTISSDAGCHAAR